MLRNAVVDCHDHSHELDRLGRANGAARNSRFSLEQSGAVPEEDDPASVTSYCDIVTVVASVHRLSCGEFSTGPPVPTLLPL